MVQVSTQMFGDGMFGDCIRFCELYLSGSRALGTAESLNGRAHKLRQAKFQVSRSLCSCGGWKILLEELVISDTPRVQHTYLVNMLIIINLLCPPKTHRQTDFKRSHVVPVPRRNVQHVSWIKDTFDVSGFCKIREL